MVRSVVAAAVDQADAADIDRLLADIDGAAADIDVGVADRGQHLRQRHAVRVELVQIDFDLILFRGAAPGVHLHDARHGQQPALQDPVLDGAQIGQPEMRRPDNLIAVNFADQARSLDLRLHVVRQADVLLQAQRRLRQREIIIDPVVEGDPNERQAIKRRRADVVHAGRGGEADFHRNGIVALHFLGRQARRLRGDFQDDRRRVRIGLDVQLRIGDEAAADEHQQPEQNDRAARQPEGENGLQHRNYPSARRSRAIRSIDDPVRRAIEEQGAVRGDQFTRPQAADHLVDSRCCCRPSSTWRRMKCLRSVVTQAVIVPSPSRAMAVDRDRERVLRLAGIDDEVGEHARPQQMLRDRRFPNAGRRVVYSGSTVVPIVVILPSNTRSGYASTEAATVCPTR